MWAMTFGPDVLSPAEWEVFRYGADHLYDEIELDIRIGGGNSYTGVQAFDSLGISQKLYHLALVSDALSDRLCPTPPLTATLEATVAAVFGLLKILVDMEIDRLALNESILEDCSLRILLKNVRLEQLNEDCPVEIPHPTDPDSAEWRSIIDCIHMCICEDDDYKLAKRFKRMSAIEKFTLDLDEDYFAKPKRRTATETLRARQTLDRIICGRILRLETA